MVGFEFGPLAIRSVSIEEVSLGTFKDVVVNVVVLLNGE